MVSASTSGGDPERRPEARILQDTRPFARARDGVALWQVLSTLACHIGLLALLGGLPLPFALAPALALVGTLIRLFVLQHDAGHHSLFSDRRTNDLTGTCLSFVTGVAYEAWRLEHAWHHSHQGKLSHRGVDRMNSPMTADEARARRDHADRRTRTITPPKIFVLGAISLLVVRKMSGGFFHFRPGFRGPTHGRERMRRSVWITNTGHLAVHFVGFTALGERWLLALAALVIAGGIGATLFWIQHNFERTWHADDRAWSFVRVALEGSSYLRLGPLLRWVTGSIGLHHVHHLNPGIPNYRLEEARRAVPELAAVAPLTRDDLRRCYTHMFWDGARRRLITRASVDAADAS